MFWILTAKHWHYDTLAGIPERPPRDLDINLNLDQIKQKNQRQFCLTTTTIDAGWHSDFAKSYSNKLVQIEAQFGKVESMFKDFCGFKMAYADKRLALGIEIVMFKPSEYFAHRKNSIRGMAGFELRKRRWQ